MLATLILPMLRVVVDLLQQATRELHASLRAILGSQSVQDGESGVDLIAVEAYIGIAAPEDTMVICSSTKGASRTQALCCELLLLLL
mmetsp:Transcript_83768/g.161729  ORF Transcript_83768/g.161729 Transcript_83768/m.161729 type:complete len:87 (+) Transcript_83768:231-491(+)